MEEIMKLAMKSVAALSLACGLSLGLTVPLSAHPNSWFQYGERWEGLRGLVDRTQSDLRASAGMEHNDSKQRDRYRNAQEHLSTFDRHLTKGHFDKDELDRAIGDVQSVLDHNTLEPGARDALLRDVNDLRAARERRY
jgi:hypothetical protein